MLVRTLPPLPNSLIARRRRKRLLQERGHKIPRPGMFVASIHCIALSIACCMACAHVPTIRAGPSPFAALFRSTYAPCSTSFQNGSVPASKISLLSGRMRGSSASVLYSNVCALLRSALASTVGCLAGVCGEIWTVDA